MKITPRKNKKKIIIITAIIVLLAIGTTAAAYFYKLGPFATSGSTVNMAPATQDQQEAGDAIKQQSSDAATENKPSGSDQPQAPVSQPNGKSTVTVSIPVANQNGNVVQIRSLIEVISSDGTCTLTLSKPGYASVVKTAKTQAQASTSTCQGFDIPVSELSTGTWNISLVFESASLKGEASKTVTIQ